MNAHELLLTGVRALAVYGVMLVVIRLLGKRTVGNFSAFDLLVALMLGEVVDEIIYGDIAFLQGMTAIGALALAHYLNSWLNYSSPVLSRLLEGGPTPVVVDGELDRAGMRKEHMNDQDVRAALRLAGVDEPSLVKRASVESDGEVSVILQDWAEPVRRGDLDAWRAGPGGRPERERA